MGSLESGSCNIASSGAQACSGARVTQSMQPVQTEVEPDVQPSSWQCSQCTLANSSQRRRCEACLAPRDAIAAAAEAVQQPNLEINSRVIASSLHRLQGRGEPRFCWVCPYGILWSVSLAVVGFIWGLVITYQLLGGMVGALAGAFTGGTYYCVTVFMCRPQIRGRPITRWLLTAEPQRSGGSGRRAPQSQGDSPRRPSFSGHLRSLPLHTLTAADITALPADQRECAICIRDFARGEKQRTLPCFHRFHSACVDQWLQRKGSCPTCKLSIDGTGVAA